MYRWATLSGGAVILRYDNLTVLEHMHFEEYTPYERF